MRKRNRNRKPAKASAINGLKACGHQRSRRNAAGTKLYYENIAASASINTAFCKYLAGSAAMLSVIMPSA